MSTLFTVECWRILLQLEIHYFGVLHFNGSGQQFHVPVGKFYPRCDAYPVVSGFAGKQGAEEVKSNR